MGGEVWMELDLVDHSCEGSYPSEERDKQQESSNDGTDDER